jgi:hypothetical protein
VTPPHTSVSAEAIETIAGHGPTADAVVRMARLARAGRLHAFREVVLTDLDLDEDTRVWVLDMTEDEGLLLAVGLYLEHARQPN